MGLASKEEQAEFEQLCLEYPELVAARNIFELSLEKRAFEDTPHPPAFLKEQFINYINQNTTTNQSKVIQMEPAIPLAQSGSGLRWLAVASVIFLLVSSWLAYRFYNETITLKAELQHTKEAQANLGTRLKILEDYEKMVINPNVAVVNLTPMPEKSPASANIYWDSTTSNVYLIIKNMPKLPSDKQYQLWALIDGKPKDLGLFDIKDDHKVMLKMTDTRKAEAFAITVEKRGNTSGPDMDQLQMMGKTQL
ncbi:MAG: hypothetical protein JWM28_626 [Chitinophagaceae bacterium]|nr:hypothetical protein [Chitinophagaceae bacterium]